MAAGWMNLKTLALTEQRFRISVAVINAIIIVAALVTIGVSVNVYMHQKSLVWQYVEPDVNPPVVVVALTCIILLIAVTLGCLTAVKFELLFLKIYCGVLLVEVVLTFIMALLVLCLFGSRQEIQVFDDKFEGGILNYKNDANAAKFMDEAQKTLLCCGINSYEDWARNKQFNCSNGLTLSSSACSVPPSCCVNEQSGCGLNALNVSYAFDETKIFTEGCVSAAANVVQHYAYVVGSLCLMEFAFLAVEFVLIAVYIYMHTFNMSANSQVASDS